MLYLEYQQTQKLPGLLDGWKPLLDVSVEDFFNLFFNIDTCYRFALDNWGRLLNFNRYVKVPDYSGGIFGFDTGTPPSVSGGYPQNFDNGNFYGGQYKTITLPDDEYRLFLKLRFGVLHCNYSIGQISRIMNRYAKSRDESYQVIVSTIGPMEMEFNFNYALNQYENAVFANENILPVPAGVAYIVTST